MTNAALVAELSTRRLLPRKTVRALLDDLADIVRAAMARGERVSLPNFVTFRCVETKGRHIRNPVTGEPMWLEPRWTIKARVAASWRTRA
jgi:DNA-binding protein HU-beta